MYKVFIDHKPIVIRKNAIFSTNSEQVFAEDIIRFPQDIEDKLSGVSIQNPLQIVSKNVEDDFKRFFKNYQLVLAAGGMVQSKVGVLVIERNGYWDIPKGKMEEGETPEESALREIEEECGIHGHVIEQLLTITYHTYVYKGQQVLKKTYWYKLNYSGTDVLIPQGEEGITRVEWFQSNRFSEIRENTYGSIHEVLDAYESL